MNQCILVGIVKEKPVFKETSNGNRLGQVVIEVKRPYRNAEGTFDSDLFQVTLWKGIAEECEKNIKVGMMLGIRGRLQSNNFEKDSEIYYRSEVVAEKVSFLAIDND